MPETKLPILDAYPNNGYNQFTVVAGAIYDGERDYKYLSQPMPLAEAVQQATLNRGYAFCDIEFLDEKGQCWVLQGTPRKREYIKLGDSEHVQKMKKLMNVIEYCECEEDNLADEVLTALRDLGLCTWLIEESKKRNIDVGDVKLCQLRYICAEAVQNA